MPGDYSGGSSSTGSGYGGRSSRVQKLGRGSLAGGSGGLESRIGSGDVVVVGVLPD